MIENGSWKARVPSLQPKLVIDMICRQLWELIRSWIWTWACGWSHLFHFHKPEENHKIFCLKSRTRIEQIWLNICTDMNSKSWFSCSTIIYSASRIFVFWFQKFSTPGLQLVCGSNKKPEQLLLHFEPKLLWSWTPSTYMRSNLLSFPAKFDNNDSVEDNHEDDIVDGAGEGTNIWASLLWADMVTTISRARPTKISSNL